MFTDVIRDRVVLVTGGTGSLGSQFAKRMGELGPREVRVISRDEAKQARMRLDHPHIRYILGDVRNPDRLREAMRGVDIVFHAAALKHVPAGEEHPTEYARTNVIGTQNVRDAAVDAGVECMIALSTDKAVSPINAMGISKALMEKVVTSANETIKTTRFACVRYGNVLGSRGSVVPFFRSLIQQGKDVTITDPKMTRFLLTLDDAVDVILFAIKNAQGGEVFVKKAPAARMDIFAEAICHRYAEQGVAYPRVITGIRRGEKIHEDLIGWHEAGRTRAFDGYYAVLPEYRSLELNEAPAVDEVYTSGNAEQLTTVEPIDALLAKAELCGETY